MDKLTFQKTSQIILATNKFINVPEVLKFEDTNLIEIVRDKVLGLTTQIPIYHSDGTYLAKVVGTRVFKTKAGEKAGIRIDKLANVWECKLENKTMFEIHHEAGDSFKTLAELYTPEGYFVKISDTKAPNLIDISNKGLQIGNLLLMGNTFVNTKTGIWLKKDGTVRIGVS